MKNRTGDRGTAANRAKSTAGCPRGQPYALSASRRCSSLRRTWLQTPASGRFFGPRHACGAAFFRYAQTGIYFLENGDCQTRLAVSRPYLDRVRTSQVQLKSSRDSLGQPGPLNYRAIVKSTRTSVGNRSERGKDRLYSGSMVRARFASLDQELVKSHFSQDHDPAGLVGPFLDGPLLTRAPHGLGYSWGSIDPRGFG